MKRVVYVTMIALVAAVCLWQSIAGGLSAKEFATLLFPLFATFLGATFAFRLEQERDANKLDDARKEALNRSLLVLALQWNEVVGLLKNLHPYATAFERAFMAPAFQPPEIFDHRQKPADLTFLLHSGKPQICMTVALEQMRFDQCIYAVRIRNSFYISEVQPEMARNFRQGQRVSEGEFETLLGERLFETAMNHADTVFTHLTQSEQSLTDALSELRAVAKGLYPDYKFMTLEPIAANADSASTTPATSVA